MIKRDVNRLEEFFSRLEGKISCDAHFCNTNLEIVISLEDIRTILGLIQFYKEHCKEFKEKEDDMTVEERIASLKISHEQSEIDARDFHILIDNNKIVRISKIKKEKEDD